MHRPRAWSKHGTQAIILELPSATAVSHTIIGVVSTFDVVNVSIQDPGNVKKERLLALL
ncbi:hypothetical protein FB192DRAFT_1373091 [Mucor lusitanicus]|uniref:Uncharacterized protein n=1 Tax=Mucor circinelloides f. lusitanicus TaxID=29924 RepID=A0A8H4BHI8_MUCCL|nr:hypothetical protein FB192DRAFT_1373091 [Mucor lusitanicus]